MQKRPCITCSFIWLLRNAASFCCSCDDIAGDAVAARLSELLAAVQICLKAPDVGCRKQQPAVLRQRPAHIPCWSRVTVQGSPEAKF